jgi:hypothetical protein
MTALGSNAHIFAQPHRREDLRWCYHAPNAIDNFCFDITLSYRRLERPRRVTGG